MAGYANDDARRIIPRWSWLHAQRAAEDFAPAVAATTSPEDLQSVLESALEVWNSSPSDVAAGELCAAALLASKPEVAHEAAESLVARHAPESGIYRIAAGALGLPLESSADGAEAKIRMLRHALREGGRDPIRWADLARSYAIVGKSKAAKDAMIVAEQLGRGGRVIARAASRCFIHADEPDRAHDSLIRSRRARHDPWVLAAEIAVSNLSGQPSEYTRDARKLLKSGRYSGIDLCELRVALASQEFWFGQRRLGRRLAKEALGNPTENGLAQIAWLNRHGYLVDGDFERGSIHSAEASAWSSLESASFEQCVASCDDWWRLEQFSSRPSELGSFVAATALGDSLLCIEQAKRGLQANSDSVVLWNNLAVGLAEEGQIREAAEALKRAIESDEGQQFAMMLSATRGLVAFRSGDVELGRRQYDEAIRDAEKSKDSRRAKLARMYLHREEVRGGVARDDLVTAMQAGATVDDSAMTAMAARLKCKINR